MKTKPAFRLTALWLCCFAILLLCVADPAAGRERLQQSGSVVYCIDGDTFKLGDRRIVRLAGIDAPEISHKNSPAQYYSRESRQALERMARGQDVILEFPGISSKDRHGRLIANALLENGQSLNESMVEQGAAFFYPHQDLGPEFQERLLALQTEAINERRGMWAHILSLPLARDNYIGNRASLRFFPSNCPEAGHIKPRNRVHFGTLMDAFLAGYAPARICIFWPNAKKN